MHYLEFFYTINPFVLAALAFVAGCGLYDRWMHSREK
jgi:drug/metabolite transporter superfamily protein YnfA